MAQTQFPLDETQSLHVIKQYGGSRGGVAFWGLVLLFLVGGFTASKSDWDLGRSCERGKHNGKSEKHCDRFDFDWNFNEKGFGD